MTQVHLSPLLSLHIGKKSSHVTHIAGLTNQWTEQLSKDEDRSLHIHIIHKLIERLGARKILPISQELFDLLKNWRNQISEEGYILRSINRHGHFGSNLHPASISNILKAIQIELADGTKVKSFSGHLFKVGVALDLLEKGEPLERIILRGGWQTDSTTMKYLRNWTY